MNTEKISFWDMLEDTYKKDWWSYYSDLNTKTQAYLTENYLTNSREFIAAYIGIANKYVSDVRLTNFINSLQEWRAQHIVSTFLTGCYLYKKSDIIKKRIEEKVIKPMRKCSNEETEPLRHSIEFQLLWFLICLFHDLGYKYEDEEVETDAPELPKDSKIPLPVSNLYNNVYKKYMDYRCKEHGKKDHGIYGGLRLYHDLCALRKQEVDKIEQKNPLLYRFLNGKKLSDKDFKQAISKEEQEKNYSEIRKKRIMGWHKTVEHSYNYAAWVILAHNIWYVRKSNPDRARYEEYKLNELILEDGVYPITLSEYPLLFLFCLVDTIEPIKRIKNINLLKDVFLTIDENNKKIIINSNISCSCNDLLIKQAKDLKDWLTQTKVDNEICPKSVEINLL